MGAEQAGRYSTTMGISIPVRRGRRPDWFLLARVSSRNHRASALSKFRMPHKLDFRHFLRSAS